MHFLQLPALLTYVRDYASRVQVVRVGGRHLGEDSDYSGFRMEHGVLSMGVSR